MIITFIQPVVKVRKLLFNRRRKLPIGWNWQQFCDWESQYNFEATFRRSTSFNFCVRHVCFTLLWHYFLQCCSYVSWIIDNSNNATVKLRHINKLKQYRPLLIELKIRKTSEINIWFKIIPLLNLFRYWKIIIKTF